MSSYHILNNEAPTVKITGRQLKIFSVFVIISLITFSLFYQKTEPTHALLMENPFLVDSLSAQQKEQLCTIVTERSEERVIAPVTLDPNDSTFNFTFMVRKNIEAVLGGYMNESTVKPFGNIYEHFKVCPSLKIASCENPKAMSTVMMNLMCYLYDEEAFLYNNNSIPSTWWSSSACAYRNAPKTHREVLRNMPFGVNYMAVIREPFGRFISAYLNKCVFETSKNILPGCFNCSTAEEPNCIVEKLYDILTTGNFNKEIDNDLAFHYETYHFAPQTWVCRMKDIYKSTSFIRYADNGYEKSQMYSNLVSSLRAFNVPQRNLDYIERSFESERRTWHATQTMDGRDKLIDNILSNQTLYDMLMEIYKYDYDIFQFTPPEFRKKDSSAAATSE